MEFKLENRLDSNNAKFVQEEIDEKLKKSDDLSKEVLIFDLRDLNYISSAGLRVFLYFRKKVKEINVINVQPSVYDIFEVTGFVDLLSVEKAYREIDVSGCEKLGEGANGTVYILDSETIVKVYKKPVMDDIKKERYLAKTAFSHGIPTAISFDIVKIGNTFGTVFEFLNATSLSRLMLKNKDEFSKYVREYTDLLKAVHNTKMEGINLPSAKDVFLTKLTRCRKTLDDELYNRIEKYVSSITEDKVLLHGDFHTNNILVQNEELLLIDMDTLSYGNIAFEFCGIFISYIGFAEIDPNETLKFFGFTVEFARDFYLSVLKSYFGLDEYNKYENQFALLGYIRLLMIYSYSRYSEDELTKTKINNIIKRIKDILEKI